MVFILYSYFTFKIIHTNFYNRKVSYDNSFHYFPNLYSKILILYIQMNMINIIYSLIKCSSCWSFEHLLLSVVQIGRVFPDPVASLSGI